MITFKVTGMESLLKQMASYNKKLSSGVDEVLTKGAINIATIAKSTAPKGKSGALSASISADVSAPFRKTITVSAPYGAFVEFGTGVNVFKDSSFNFTPEIRAYAMEFYVSGLGRLYARPYLFPALEREKKVILSGIKKVLFPSLKM